MRFKSGAGMESSVFAVQINNTSERSNGTLRYLVDFIAGGMNSIAKNYVLTGCTADGAFLEHLMYKLFGGGYFAGKD